MRKEKLCPACTTLFCFVIGCDLMLECDHNCSKAIIGKTRRVQVRHGKTGKLEWRDRMEGFVWIMGVEL